MKSILFSAVAALAVVVGVTKADAADIHDAAFNGDRAKVEQQLNSGVDVDFTDSHGTTGLMWATGNNRIEIVKLLIERGVDVNHANNNGDTALIWAAYYNLTEIAQLLIERGADVNHANNNGDTALITAVMKGRTEFAQLLIERGADVNHANNNGDTALITAARKGRTEFAQLLIECGADVNHANDKGDTALITAANTAIINALLPHLQINDMLAKDCNGRTAMDRATDDIKQLIQQRIDQLHKRFETTKSAAKVAHIDTRRTS